jgi:hypothetical protein
MNKIIQLNNINSTEFDILFSMLEQITIPKKTSTSNRRGFEIGHRAITFGYTRARFKRLTGNLYDLSFASIKYPNIYNELLRIGHMFCPFEFTSIHVNKNVTCPRHKDSKNVGSSMLVSFGNYTGGKIVIENIEYDAYSRPIIFDSNKLEHWNTEIEGGGIKYSLIYFDTCRSKNRCVKK